MKVISYNGKEPKALGVEGMERVLAILEAQLEIIKIMTATTIIIERGTSISMEEIK